VRLKCDGTGAETRFRFTSKRTSPFKSAGAPVQSTTDSRSVRISGSNAGYTTMFRGSGKGTGYPLHSPVSPSLPLPCVTVTSHFSWTLHVYCIVSQTRLFLCYRSGTGRTHGQSELWKTTLSIWLQNSSVRGVHQMGLRLRTRDLENGFGPLWEKSPPPKERGGGRLKIVALNQNGFQLQSDLCLVWKG